MLSYAVRYLVAAAALAAGDAVWLGYFGRAVVRPTLGAILRDPLNWTAVSLFYLIYAFGVVFFAVGPALRSNSRGIAILYGALFGFFAYMTYDLTNMATIQVWTWRLAATDTAWGTFITALAALASTVATRAIAPPAG